MHGLPELPGECETRFPTDVPQHLPAFAHDDAFLTVALHPDDRVYRQPAAILQVLLDLYGEAVWQLVAQVDRESLAYDFRGVEFRAAIGLHFSREQRRRFRQEIANAAYQHVQVIPFLRRDRDDLNKLVAPRHRLHIREQALLGMYRVDLVEQRNTRDIGATYASQNVFVLSGPPDMGAFELGQPLPSYGPRPLVPDLSGTRKTVSRPTPEYGETVTYTLALRNSGAPLTVTGFPSTVR